MEIPQQTFKGEERYEVYSWVSWKKSSRVICVEKMVKFQVNDKQGNNHSKVDTKEYHEIKENN